MNRVGKALINPEDKQNSSSRSYVSAKEMKRQEYLNVFKFPTLNGSVILCILTKIAAWKRIRLSIVQRS